MEAKVAANRDPRMKNMMLQNYKNWFSAGGELNLHYNLASPWGKFGSWGLTDDIEQDTPKIEAISELVGPRSPAAIRSKVPRDAQRDRRAAE